MSPEDFARAFNVSRETISRLQAYHDLLVKWQKAINLVSPKTLEDIWERHFADSAQLAAHIPENTKVADLGSGAGFPGLVLAVMRPDLEIHLVESDSRKCEFLKNVSRETKTKVQVHSDRVENALAGIGPGYITARAFAPLEELLGLIPESCRGAPLLLLKGRQALEEATAAARKFDFDMEDFSSLTDPDARILKIIFRHK
ncbi:MAG: 16S rRNA (guanine(527)-N(7))-methyltransferase RsmG [Alphaproteobacteria bacterium]